MASTEDDAKIFVAEPKWQRALRRIVDGIVAGLGTVWFVVELVFGTVASLLLTPVALLWSVPILGRIVRWVVNLVAVGVHRIGSIPDMLLWLAGIRPEKRLRVRFVVVADESGPVETREAVMRELQELIDIFRDQANVRVMPDQPWVFRTPFHGKERARDAYVTFLDEPRSKLASLSTTARSVWQDLWLRGMWFELTTAFRNPWGHLRRLTGYGAPVVVFVVRAYSDEPARGFSLGFLTDYCSILAERSDDTTAAHEVAHSCGIVWHSEDPKNLMSAGDNVRELTPGQALWLRGSRHVTYF